VAASVDVEAAEDSGEAGEEAETGMTAEVVVDSAVDVVEEEMAGAGMTVVAEVGEEDPPVLETGLAMTAATTTSPGGTPATNVSPQDLTEAAVVAEDVDVVVAVR